jgi:hypothetical protein
MTTQEIISKIAAAKDLDTIARVPFSELPVEIQNAEKRERDGMTYVMMNPETGEITKKALISCEWPVEIIFRQYTPGGDWSIEKNKNTI